MALEKLRIVIEAASGDAIRDFEKVGAASQKMGAQTDAANRKAKETGTTWSDNHPVMTRAATVTAVVGVAAFAAANRYADLGVQVQKFKDISGTSAEEASRWVAVLDDYGISAETGAKAISFLSNEASNGGRKLAEYGIEVAKNRDGSINLQGTLLNVADAYSKAGNEAERNGILASAFGRRIGADLIPVLRDGRKGIEEMFAAVPDKQILNDEDLVKAREFKLAIDNLEDAFQELVISVGGAAAGPLTIFGNTLAEGIRLLGDMDQIVGGATLRMAALGASIGAAFGHPVIGAIAGAALGIRETFRTAFGREAFDGAKLMEAAIQKNYEILGRAKVGSDEYKSALQFLKNAQLDQKQAAEDGATGQQRFATETRSAKEAAEAEHQAIVTLRNDFLGAIGATLNYESAVAAVSDAQAKLDELHRQGETDVNKLAAAQRDLERAQLQVTQSAFAQDDALKKAISEMGGGVKGAQALIQQLEAEKAAHGDASGAIQVQIDKIKDIVGWVRRIPPTALTVVDVDTSRALAKLAELQRKYGEINAGFGNISPEGVLASRGYVLGLDGQYHKRAHGGPVRAGVPYVVGEYRPELFVPDTDGTILPQVPAGVGAARVVEVHEYHHRPTFVVPPGGESEAGRSYIEAIQAFESTNGKGWRS